MLQILFFLEKWPNSANLSEPKSKLKRSWNCRNPWQTVTTWRRITGEKKLGMPLLVKEVSRFECFCLKHNERNVLPYLGKAYEWSTLFFKSLYNVIETSNADYIHYKLTTSPIRSISDQSSQVNKLPLRHY